MFITDLQRLGIMPDCSRNGVLKVAAVKQYMDILAKLGHNCLMLYTEDTYELEGQPYFGFLRGRYSHAELVYWNYYYDDPQRYDGMLRAHRCFDNTLWFASGFWAWTM